MKPAERRVFRCAIYTRKSTEHNLDLEFNSLDAQREACEAYVKSQAHEGWRLIADHYDDGAFSGASLDRPALQTVLADVRSGKINIVVVYKVDRLTRSLADFAKLVEFFDQHGVSFVSVTQSFNTTSSMGRLTLNVLLSFAQFEREVIGSGCVTRSRPPSARASGSGERFRSAIAAPTRSRSVVPEEAATVRSIFSRYLLLGSMSALIEDLDRRGIRTKANRLSDGRVRGAGYVSAWDPSPICSRTGSTSARSSITASCIAGSMSRFLNATCSRPFRQSSVPTPLSGGSALRARPPARGCAQIPCLDWRSGTSATIADRDLIDRYVGRVIVKPQAVEVGFAAEASAPSAEPAISDPDPRQISTGTISLAWTAPGFAAVKGIIHAPCATAAIKPESRDALLTAIAKAGDGSTTSGSAASPQWPRLPSAKAEGNGTSGCWHRSPSFRLAPLQRSSMAPRLLISRSPASPRPCHTRGPSRRGVSGCNRDQEGQLPRSGVIDARLGAFVRIDCVQKPNVAT
jgi:DNA invertase Pin-like site-specific DNA recombinase